MIFAGLLFWIYWGTRYGVWTDIGIYSITSVFIIAGIVGTIISLLEKEEEED
jgi:Na+/proline symporter